VEVRHITSGDLKQVIILNDLQHLSLNTDADLTAPIVCFKSTEPHRPAVLSGSCLFTIQLPKKPTAAMSPKTSADGNKDFLMAQIYASLNDEGRLRETISKPRRKKSNADELGVPITKKKSSVEPEIIEDKLRLIEEAALTHSIHDTKVEASAVGVASPSAKVTEPREDSSASPQHKETGDRGPEKTEEKEKGAEMTEQEQTTEDRKEPGPSLDPIISVSTPAHTLPEEEDHVDGEDGEEEEEDEDEDEEEEEEEEEEENENGKNGEDGEEDEEGEEEEGEEEEEDEEREDEDDQRELVRFDSEIELTPSEPTTLPLSSDHSQPHETSAVLPPLEGDGNDHHGNEN